MFSKNLFISFLFCLPLLAQSQVNNLKFWPDSNGYILELEEVPGVGLFALAETDPLGTLVKMNMAGDILWAKEFSEEYKFMFISPDQHIYLLSDETNYVSLLKLTLDGDIVWEKEYALGAFGHSKTVADMGDGGDVFLAVFGQGQFGGFDTRIMKIDSTGAVQWYKKGYCDCFVEEIVAAKDGGCFVAFNGINPQTSASYFEGEIHRFLPGGDLAWGRKYDRALNRIDLMEMTRDGFLIVVTYPNANSGGFSAYREVDRWDSLGTSLNGLSIGDSMNSNQIVDLESINTTPDNGVVLGGQIVEIGFPDAIVRGFVYHIGQYASTSYGREFLDPDFLASNRSKQISAVAGLGGQGLGAMVYAGSIGGNSSGINPHNWIGILTNTDSTCSGMPRIFGLTTPPVLISTSPSYTDLSFSVASTPPTSQVYSLRDSLLCQACLENLSASFTTTFNALTASFTDSSNGGQLTWDFGDGNTGTGSNPSHTYASAGSYNVCLTSTGICDTTTICQTVGLTLGQQENLLELLSISPNPCNETLNLDFTNPQAELEWRIFDVKGQLVANNKSKGLRSHRVDVSSFNNGVYFLELRNRDRRWGQRIIVRH